MVSHSAAVHMQLELSAAPKHMLGKKQTQQEQQSSCMLPSALALLYEVHVSITNG